MQFLKGHGYNRTIYALDFSPDGTKLASCGLDGTVRLWDLGTPQVRVFNAHYSTHAVRFSPDGRRLAWGNLYDVHLQDVEGDGVRVRRIAGGDSLVTQVAFSPDGRLLLALTRVRSSWFNHELNVLDLTSDVWSDWPGSEHCTDSLACSRDGQILAAGNQIERPARSSRRYEHSVVLWDVATRQQHARLEGPSNTITAVAFSPDGRYLAAASGVTLWVFDGPARTAAAQIRVDNLHFKSVAFSPDGRWLATARNDATVRFYDTQTWSEGPSFDWKIGPVGVMVFARDGMRAACGSSKGKIVVWDVDL
jgi:WD40 repeat protein